MTLKRIFARVIIESDSRASMCFAPKISAPARDDFHVYAREMCAENLTRKSAKTAREKRRFQEAKEGLEKLGKTAEKEAFLNPLLEGEKCRK